jgi:hypothetical protein
MQDVLTHGALSAAASQEGAIPEPIYALKHVPYDAFCMTVQHISHRAASQLSKFKAA